jgi:hypothetical protein
MTRRQRRGGSADLIPEPRAAWAEAIWRDREEVARGAAGPWMLREAAAILELPEEAVDDLLDRARSGPPARR